MKTDDTIFALATAPGRSGVAIFRISGPEAFVVLSLLCRPKTPLEPRVATLCALYHPQTDEILDRALVLIFKGPHSYSGEDVVELHIHGGRAIREIIAACLTKIPKFRLAEPGEFTRRAFENNRLDLTEAEAVADLINADTEAQRRQAMRQLDGGLRNLYEGWRAQLTRVLAYLEASIDFADEDLPKDLAEEQRGALRHLIKELQHHLDDNHRGERLRDGFSIAILGPPNAGKSSLLNRLAKRDAAIVSEKAGTTRDVIDVYFELGGYPVTLADTAGLRESADLIENEGMRRALERAQNADLKILLCDGACSQDLDPTTAALRDKNSVVVFNKADLLDAHGRASVLANVSPLFVSVKTNEGIENLLNCIIKEIGLRFADTGVPALTQLRHRTALTDCLANLERALEASGTELIAEDVRLATRSLGRITGHVDVDDLLDIIFRDFCLGK